MGAAGRTRRQARNRRQHGAVLLFALIALTVMLIAAVALGRSLSGSRRVANDTGLKRDMQNQSERAVDAVFTAVREDGALGTAARRGSDVAQSNYSAKMLPSNPRGFPTALLLSDTAFAAAYRAGDLTSDDKSVWVRYVVDRLCAVSGDESTLSETQCAYAPASATGEASSARPTGFEQKAAWPAHEPSTMPSVIYRISIRVEGPRGSRSLFQSTFTIEPSRLRSDHSPLEFPSPSPTVAPGDLALPTGSRVITAFTVRRLNWRELTLD